MSTFRIILAATLGVVAGTVMMSIFHQDPPPTKPTVQKVYVTKEVPGPTKTVTKETVPQACLDYLQTAQRVQQLVDQYEEAVGELPELIDDAGVAIYNKNQNKLNELAQRDHQLEGDSIKSLMDLNEAKSDMKSANVKCQQALKNN